jgi:hypothetical protein
MFLELPDPEPVLNGAIKAHPRAVEGHHGAGSESM